MNIVLANLEELEHLHCNKGVIHVFTSNEKTIHKNLKTKEKATKIIFKMKKQIEKKEKLGKSSKKNLNEFTNCVRINQMSTEDYQSYIEHTYNHAENKVWLVASLMNSFYYSFDSVEANELNTSDYFAKLSFLIELYKKVEKTDEDKILSVLPLVNEEDTDNKNIIEMYENLIINMVLNGEIEKQIACNMSFRVIHKFKEENIKLLLKDSQASSYGNYFLLNIVEKLNNKFILKEKEEELKKVILDSFNRNDYFSDNEFINKLKSNN